MNSALEEIAKEKNLDICTLRNDLIKRMITHFDGDEFVAVVELFFSGLKDEIRVLYLSRLLNSNYIDCIRNAGLHS